MNTQDKSVSNVSATPAWTYDCALRHTKEGTWWQVTKTLVAPGHQFPVHMASCVAGDDAREIVAALTALAKALPPVSEGGDA